MILDETSGVGFYEQIVAAPDNAAVSYSNWRDYFPFGTGNFIYKNPNWLIVLSYPKSGFISRTVHQ
ncbi:hypothetical protein [Nitrosospira briensis]|uniref:hypothetical protein n=1 Tax=Nitrosospira briensis TaxID=35799 RepID=UPI000944F781|nr:hypothetical protein [Nitrosospira briensis]